MTTPTETRDAHDEDDYDLDDFDCDRCHGDGMDPWCDYLLPCPCQGEQRPAAALGEHS